MQQLGESWQACTAIIEMIEERLLDVEVENEGFGAIVDQERQVLSILSRVVAALEALLLTFSI